VAWAGVAARNNVARSANKARPWASQFWLVDFLMIFMLFGFSFLRYGSDLPGAGGKDVRRVGRVKFSPVFFERPGRSPTDSARERLGDRKD
jgi:hypothetical protein